MPALRSESGSSATTPTVPANRSPTWISPVRAIEMRPPPERSSGCPSLPSTLSPCAVIRKPCASVVNAPLRVYCTPWSVWMAKKPVPPIAMSSVFCVQRNPLLVRFGLIDVISVPVFSGPIGAPVWVFESSMSPKATCERTSPLKPGLVALARLFAMTSCRICAASIPDAAMKSPRSTRCLLIRAPSRGPRRYTFCKSYRHDFRKVEESPANRPF